MLDALLPGLLLAGTATGLFAAAFLLVAARERPAALWLATLLAGLSLRMGKSAVHAFLPLDAATKNLGLAGMLVIGPALWLLLRGLDDARAPPPRQVLHFVPALGFAALCWAIPNERGDPISMAIYLAILAHIGTYLALALHGRRQRPPPGDRRVLADGALCSVGGAWVAWIGIFFALPAIYPFLCVAWALTSIVLVWLLLARHPALAWLTRAPRYRHLKDSDEDARTLLQRAELRVREDALYRDPDLTLGRLARRLGVSENALSRAVNQHAARGFRAWLNAQRVAHAQREIDAGWLKRSSLAHLADDCGFRTQSSFIRAFRAAAGTTPGRYASATAGSAGDWPGTGFTRRSPRRT